MRNNPGRALSEDEKCLYAPYFDAEVLACARIIEGKTPFWLRKRMNAVVLQNRIYFRHGVYEPDSVRGIELLAHELTHVEQFMRGMTIGNYLWASRRGYSRNHYETEAYARAAEIRRLCSKLSARQQA